MRHQRPERLRPIWSPRGDSPRGPPLAQRHHLVQPRTVEALNSVGALVMSGQRGGLLFAVGGIDGEQYADGQPLTRQWADHVPELAWDPWAATAPTACREPLPLELAVPRVS